jgi:flagellar protein FliS
MYRNATDAYLESRICSARPLELVGVLYGACLDSVREARRHLAGGVIAERSRAITKACEVLLELTNSLDHQRGGEIAGRLGQLYEYMMQRLLDANLEQSDAPLAEVLGLLTTLSEGFNGVARQEDRTPPTAAQPWAPYGAESSYASQAWSF